MTKPSRQQLLDEWLVMRAQDGEAEAMDELVRRWQEPLWRYAFRLTGLVDAAWDVLQDAWLAVFRGLRRLDDPARFRPWAYRIVMHKAADWIRRRRRKHDTLAESTVEAPPDVPPADERVGDVRAALAGLPAAQRMVLVMHYMDEAPVAEIAEMLGIPPGTVKSRLHHGRNELRRRLGHSD